MTMRRLWAMILLGLATALLAGCFQVERTVRLNPDGSGTVEEIVLVGKTLTGMFDAMDAGNAGDSTEKAPAKKSFVDQQQESARDKVAKMGEGVSLVSVTPVTQGEFEGFKAVYAFKDINKLQLPADATPADQGAGSGKAITYQLTGGDKKTLVVRNPPTPKAPTAPDQPETQQVAATSPQGDQPADQQGLELLKQMFNGMKITERIVIEKGTVLETNALYRTGSEITMVDVDFGKLLSTNPAELAKLQAVPPNDKEKLLQAMGTIQGFKVDVNEELRVVFKGGK